MLFIIPDFRFRVVIGLLEILALCGESVFLWIVVPPTSGSTPPIGMLRHSKLCGSHNLNFSVRLVALSIGSILYAIIWCLSLNGISQSKRPAPQWIRSAFNPKMGVALGISASKFLSPANFSLRRNKGIDGDKDVLAEDYDQEDQGYHEVTNGVVLGENEVLTNENSWKTFAAIISRIVLVHYAIMTVVVIAMNA